MKLGYMTNAFGPLVGEGGGVTSIKDIQYLTLCDDEAVLKKITNAGFRYIEVLEGNLTKYGSDIQVLKDMLARYGAGMMSVAWAPILSTQTRWRTRCFTWRQSLLWRNR